MTDGDTFLYAVKYIGLIQATKLVCIGRKKKKSLIVKLYPISYYNLVDSEMRLISPYFKNSALS